MSIQAYCLMFAVLTATALNGCKPTAPPDRSKAPAGNASVVVVTEAACTGDVAQTVSVSGSLVALQDIALSAKQGGRLAEMTVREGARVATGQILARVDAMDLESQVRADEASVYSALAKLEQTRAAYHQQTVNTEAAIASARAAYDQQVATSSAQVRSAQSALAAVRANLSALQEGARPEERQQTQAALASAQANFKKAQADTNRYEKLHNAGAVSDAEMDQYLNARDVAQANLNSAQAALRLQQEGSRRQDIEQAQEKVRQAEETLRQTQAARAADEVKKADLQTALANRAQNQVKLADVQAAQAAVQQSQNTLDIARQAVNDTIVRSPINGVVSARTAEPGQVVTSATVLLHVIALDDVYFEPTVSDSAMADISAGQAVKVRIDAFPGRTFQGVVTRIYPQASAASRTVSLRVTVSKARALLRPNMFAQGDITTAIHRNAILIPRRALVQTASGSSGDAEQPSVFTVENGAAHQHRVTPGLTADKGDWIEVKGLPASSTVVVLGQNSLQDGQKVTVSSQTADAQASAH